MISAADMLSRDQRMSAAQRRLALAQELRAEHEEAERLSEMIRMLRVSPGMKGERISLLIAEWMVAREREIALEEELRALDAPSGGDEFAT